jgi:hypothetical protein
MQVDGHDLHFMPREHIEPPAHMLQTGVKLLDLSRYFFSYPEADGIEVCLLMKDTCLNDPEC